MKTISPYKYQDQRLLLISEGFKNDMEEHKHDIEHIIILNERILLLFKSCEYEKTSTLFIIQKETNE